MGAMKELKMKIDGAIPTICPYCQNFIDDYVDWEALYKVFDLLLSQKGEESTLLGEHGYKEGETKYIERQGGDT